MTSFCIGDYDFQFDKNTFRYKGKSIYLCGSQKAYLASWLLNAHKDNSKRMILCNLRKKFGADFATLSIRYPEASLSDVEPLKTGVIKVLLMLLFRRVSPQ